MKIVYLDAYTVNHGDLTWDDFTDLGVLKVHDFTPPEEIVSRALDAEILIVNKTKLDQTHFSKLPNLKYIVVSATGYNNIDIKEAKQHGILVSNVSGYSSYSVVQYIYSTLLSIFGRVDYYQDQVKNGRWSKTRDFCFYDHSITELGSKTIGVYGYGNIGSSVARMAHGFGMKVLVVNKYPETTDLRIADNVDSDFLFSNSDIISLHTPLNQQTKEFINNKNLAQMKTNGILINTARGGIINEAHLADFLKANESFTAILDVLSTEPPAADHPLIGIPNCKITPHLAWASAQSRERLLVGVARNIRAYQDEIPMNLVS